MHDKSGYGKCPSVTFTYTLPVFLFYFYVFVLLPCLLSVPVSASFSFFCLYSPFSSLIALPFVISFSSLMPLSLTSINLIFSFFFYFARQLIPWNIVLTVWQLPQWLKISCVLWNRVFIIVFRNSSPSPKPCSTNNDGLNLYDQRLLPSTLSRKL